MPEIYCAKMKGCKLELEFCDRAIPAEILNGNGVAADWRIFCRMGDPALIACDCWKKNNSSEAVFKIGSEGRCLFYVVSENGLAFAEALSHFGNLCANARYGADIFEESGEDYD